MNINNRIVEYLNNNNWEVVYETDGLLHYTKFAHNTLHHLFVSYYKDTNSYEVELGLGENQDNSEFFKLRNLVSVLKRRNI